ncbi:MAG: DUF5063 domain-containing protein [Bacteroidota bacterium]|nr:DUF5063 domain-containing protein [Bacteroidota bacterium]
MKEELKKVVFSPNVIEFLTVAKEYCNFLENIPEMSRIEFLSTVQKILTLLYLKGAMLPKVQYISEDEESEKFVTEKDWTDLNNKLLLKFGNQDIYTEVFLPEARELGEPVNASLSENLSDIYQDLKDFVSVFKSGDEELVNDALCTCQTNFEQYWGQLAVNALGAIHSLCYNPDETFQEEEDEVHDHKPNIDSSFIAQRQRDYQNND